MAHKLNCLTEIRAVLGLSLVSSVGDCLAKPQCQLALELPSAIVRAAWMLKFLPQCLCQAGPSLFSLKQALDSINRRLSATFLPLPYFLSLSSLMMFLSDSASQVPSRLCCNNLDLINLCDAAARIEN